MQILIVSDTHGSLRNYRRVLKKFSVLDHVVHLGDYEGDADRIVQITPFPVSMVCGNCDYWGSAPASLVLTFGKERVFLAHGHRYGVNWGFRELAEAAREYHCTTALCGHTHMAALEEVDGVTVLNPGSLSRPRPWTARPSYAIMEIDREQKVHYTLCSLEEE